MSLHEMENDLDLDVLELVTFPLLGKYVVKRLVWLIWIMCLLIHLPYCRLTRYPSSCHCEGYVASMAMHKQYLLSNMVKQ